MSFLPDYGSCAGPFGFPLPDPAARALDRLLQKQPRGPEYVYRRLVAAAAPPELTPGERAEVSWISTESIDRLGTVILSAGMDDSQFALNPLVTLAHDYRVPPVGRSLWRRRSRDGTAAGVRAKTRYPERPPAWPASDPWPPDRAFALIQAGLLQGKSIGFLPLRSHVPTTQEAERNGWGDRVALVIDEWLLLEYACVFLPANQDALVEAVARGALGLPPVAFTAMDEVERHIGRAVAALDLPAVIEMQLKEIWRRRTGRV
jgi:hypothetical protein